MRLVHLSDIHLSNENINELKKYYIEALLEDLQLYNRALKIDLLLITGDLIDKGGESFNDSDPYEIFQSTFLSPIQKALHLSDSQVLFIPGNHDIQRSRIDKTYELGLLASLKSIESVNERLKIQQEHFDLGNQRIELFKKFEAKYKTGNGDYIYSNNESLHFRTLANGKKIGFLLVNDSWRCSKELQVQNHVIGVDQLFNAKKYFSEQGTDFNIVLFHHPLDFLSEIERSEIKAILQKFDFELVFMGHTHKVDAGSNFGPAGNIFLINAKSAFNDPRQEIAKFQPGYNIVDIDLDTLSLRCSFRSYIHRRFSFDKDVSASNDGVYECKLSPKGNKRDYYDLFTLANKTVQSHIEDFNSSLVLYKTNTIAPKNINEIFVLPELTDKPDNFESVENVIKFTIEELLSAEEDLMIIGGRETGKSTLLAKISSTSVDNFMKIQKIPVIVDYKKLNKEDVLSSIRKYLNETNERIRTLVENGKILLLVDNVDESEDYIYAKKHLETFITLAKGNKIIATTARPIESMVQQPLSFISKKLLKPVYIGSVGVKEFKELAVRWFQRKDEEWHHTNLEKLIQVFKILRIPRTFFSVSLFLWIIEKQEDFKPINKSYLVNRFLRFILEGLVEDEAKAGVINFDRKIEILAEVALKMYEDSSAQESYSLNEEDIINVIDTYLKMNQRTTSAIAIYQGLFEKGIFKVDSDNMKVTFRFESFFQYFLSLNIDFKTEFKEHVLTPQNSLSFIDELEYYTGRNQGDKEVLIYSISLLKESFKEIDSFIKDNTDKYFPKQPLLIHYITDLTAPEKIRETKLSDQEINKLLDEEMSKLPVSESLKIKQEYSDYNVRFPTILELAARVLKNAENIQDPNLINDSLDCIIEKTSKFAVLSRAIMLQFMKDEKNELSSLPTVFTDFLGALLPLMHQELLLTWMGTDFLQGPLENRIKKYIDNPKHGREYETFLITFLYSDLKLKNYIKYTDGVIKGLNSKYLAELFFFKILVTYSKKPNTSGLLPDLERQMINLLMIATGMSKSDAKSKVEVDIREKRADTPPDELF